MTLAFGPSDVFPKKKKKLALNDFLEAMNDDYRSLLEEGGGRVPSRRINGTSFWIKILLGEKYVKEWNRMSAKEVQSLGNGIREEALKSGWKGVVIVPEENQSGLRIILKAS